MNATAQSLYTDLSDQSGIRQRMDVTGLIHFGTDDAPSCVYLELMNERFFLGVRFPTGTIVNADWDVGMVAAGVPECIITATYVWLTQRAI